MLTFGDYFGADDRRIPDEINKKPAKLFALSLLYQHFAKDDKNLKRLSEISAEMKEIDEEIRQWIRQQNQ